MDIVISKRNSLKVIGQISSVNDSDRLIHNIEEICNTGTPSLRILFKETKLLGSAVLSHLVRLACKDCIKVSVEVTDEHLHDLIESMGLRETINLSLVSVD